MLINDNELDIQYGETTYSFAKYPVASLLAMARRGVSHYFGSEAASAVQTKVTKAICAGANDDESKANKKAFDELPSAERRAKLAAWRAANESAYNAMVSETYAEFLKDMESGEIGVSTRGPVVDPLTAQITALAKARVSGILKKSNIAVPKKADDVVKTAGGEFTMAQLVARQLAKPDVLAELTKEAKTILAAKERANKKAASESADSL